MSATNIVPALRVEGLAKRFREVAALTDVNFEVRQGELTVILGAAGAGKTTLLRLIAGLDTANSGRVLLRGQDATLLQPKDRDIGMIFDNLALYPDKTAFQNIASPLSIRGVAAADIQMRVNRLAATLRIEYLLERLPRTMSGGERQRVALGRALVRQPSLCLLDEPLSSLDAMLRTELRAEFRRLQKELGYTFVLASPDYSEALAVADRVVMLREGGVVQVGLAQELYESPADREVARFIGVPEINVLDGSIEHGTRSLLVAGARVQVSEQLAVTLTASSAFEVGLRPEYLIIANPTTAHVAAEVIDIEPLGLRSTLTVRNAQTRFRLLVPAAQVKQVKPGEIVGVDFGHAPLLFFDKSTGARLI